MKFEDAYFFKILLMSGLRDGYEDWLNTYLENENPLSEIVLNLAQCESDLNKTITCLHNYCEEAEFDKNAVCEKLRLFMKEAYHTGKLSKEEVSSYMSRFAINHGDPGDYDFDMNTWGSMYYMNEYFTLAQETIIPWERFNAGFYSYLNDGTLLSPMAMWGR